MSSSTGSKDPFIASLSKIYAGYTGGFAVFVVLLAILEQMGVSDRVIGYLFVFLTIGVYAYIGIISRTAAVAEYYVAGRRVPALYNGMATGSDWMSAASFIGMAGSLYALGYGGLAFILGWTGGYMLVAILLAPYLRKFGQYTVPDFLGARFGGNIPRALGVTVLLTASFVYVVAQIVGVGIITQRFLDVSFGVAVFLGLAGILVCSMLGGMRAVTWTQVAQYIILIIAYLLPAILMSVKVTGVPVPQLMYGFALERIEGLEQGFRAAGMIPPPGVTGFHTAPFAAANGTFSLVRGLELLRAGVLPDGRHRRAAAHPDALLHHPFGARSAAIRGVVAVLHLPAVLHRAGLCRLRQARDLPDRHRPADRSPAGVDQELADHFALRHALGEHRRREPGRHRPVGRIPHPSGRGRAGDAGNRRAALCHRRPGRGRWLGGGAVHRGWPAAGAGQCTQPRTSTTR
jgi:hypothetical protein